MLRIRRQHARVARLADVNEATLFRYFPRKQDLFWTALQPRLDRVRLMKELQQGLSRRTAQNRLCHSLSSCWSTRRFYQSELTRLLYVGLLELRLVERLYRQHLAPILNAIHDYLKQRVSNGSVRNCDSSITTVASATSVLAPHEAVSNADLDFLVLDILLVSAKRRALIAKVRVLGY